MAKKPQKKQPSFKNVDRNLSPSVIAAIVILVLALIAIVVAVVALTSNKGFSIRDLDSYSEDNAYVQLDVKDYGTIILELDPSAAPITVANFTKLVGSGFYDGLTFHRIISGFMIQGGDPQGTGMGGSDTKIKGEFSSNGWDNPIEHTRGVISMARSSDPDSASSQFFIVHKDSPHLNGLYAAFGRVVVGMDVVDAIAAVRTDSGDYPLEKVVIERALLLQDAPQE